MKRPPSRVGLGTPFIPTPNKNRTRCHRTGPDTLCQPKRKTVAMKTIVPFTSNPVQTAIKSCSLHSVSGLCALCNSGRIPLKTPDFPPIPAKSRSGVSFPRAHPKPKTKLGELCVRALCALCNSRHFPPKTPDFTVFHAFSPFAIRHSAAPPVG